MIKKALVRYVVVYGAIDFVIYVILGPSSKLNFTAYIIIFLVLFSGGLFLKSRVGKGNMYKLLYIAMFAAVYTFILLYVYGPAIPLAIWQLFLSLFILQVLGYVVSSRVGN